MATRIGDDGQKTGGAARRYSTVCLLPAESMVTSSVESGRTRPAGLEAAHDDSREKENDSMTRAG